MEKIAKESAALDEVRESFSLQLGVVSGWLRIFLLSWIGNGENRGHCFVFVGFGLKLCNDILVKWKHSEIFHFDKTSTSTLLSKGVRRNT